MFLKGEKVNSYSGWSRVREHHLYNILVFENVETCHSGGVKKPVLFLKADSAPDGSLVCESALETRSRIMSSEMWWCSLYLPDRCWAPPPLAHMKVYCMTPVSHSFSHSLALLNKHSRTHTEQPPNTTVPAHTHLHWFDLLLHFHTFVSHLLRFSVVLDTSDRAEPLKELDLQVRNLLE